MANMGDFDELMHAGWGEPGGEWTGWGWRNEDGSKISQVMHLKEWLVICNEEDTDGRANVTTNEERVL